MYSVDDLRKERDGLNEQLQQAIANVQQLRGAVQVLTNLIDRKSEEKEG